MDQVGSDARGTGGPERPAQDGGVVDSPQGALSGLSGLSARYRSFSPGGVVQSQQNQTMMLRAATMQMSGGPGKEDSGMVSRIQMRKNSEALEEKLLRHLRKMNQEMSNTVDASIATLEKRVSGTETLQKKLEKKFAQVEGNWKGLSEEMQLQIRRTAELDSKVSEVRRQVTEELRQRNMDFEQKLQKAASDSRRASGSLEEQQKGHARRLQVVEGFLEERVKHEMDEIFPQLEHLSARIAALEDSQASVQEAPLTPVQLREPEPLDLDQHATIMSFQRQLKDLKEALDHTTQETHEVHHELAAHEERLNTMRTMLETKEGEHRIQTQHSELEGKLETLRQNIHDKSLEKAEHADSIEMLNRRLTSQEEAHEELRNHWLGSKNATSLPGCASAGHSTPRGASPHPTSRSLGAALSNVSGLETPGDRGLPPPMPGQYVVQVPVDTAQVDSHSLSVLEARVEDSECRIGETVERIVERMEIMQRTLQQVQKGHHDVDEINDLVEHLRGVAPKVIEHDLQVKDHREQHFAIRDTLEKQTDVISRMQAAIEKLDNMHTTGTREIKEELAALCKDHGDKHGEVQRLVEQIGSQPTVVSRGLEMPVQAAGDSGSTTLDAHGDTIALLTREASAAMQCCSALQTEIAALKNELSVSQGVSQEEFNVLSQEVKNAMQCCKDVQTDLQTLSSELRAATRDEAAAPVSNGAIPGPTPSFDAEGKHAEMHARVRDLENTHKDLHQRVLSCEKSSDDWTSAAGKVLEVGKGLENIGKEDMPGRLKLLEDSFRGHKETTAALEQGMLEHRAAIEKTTRALDSIPQHGDLAGRVESFENKIADVPAVISRMEEVETKRAAIEKALAEHKLEVERALASQRATSSDQDLTNRLEETKRELAEQRTSTERALAEHRSAADRHLELEGRIGAAERAAAEHQAVQSRLAAAEQDLAEHKAVAPTQGHIQQLERSHSALSERVAEMGANSEKVTEMGRRLAEFETKFAKLGAERPTATHVQALGDIAEGEGEKLLELMNAVNQDDEAEQRAHRSLLGRIDELCEHLIAMKEHSSQSDRSNGASPDVSKLVEDALARVQQNEEWQKRMEEQMKAMHAVCSQLRPTQQDEDF